MREAGPMGLGSASGVHAFYYFADGDFGGLTGVMLCFWPVGRGTSPLAFYGHSNQSGMGIGSTDGGFIRYTIFSYAMSFAV